MAQYANTKHMSFTPPGPQRGLTLIGLLFMLAILGMFIVLGFKVVPTVLEYRAITNAIKTVKTAGSVREIQQAFDRNATATYIDSIKGTDLIITKEEEGMEVSFSYQKKIPLFGPASLVLDYAGTTAKSGIPALPKVDE